MINYTLKMLLNQKTEGEGGAGFPPLPKSEPETKSDSTPNDAASKAQGPETDDYGYEVSPEEKASKEKEGDKQKETTSEESEEAPDPSSGYGSEPEAVVEEEAKPDDKKVDPPAATEIDKSLEGLPEQEVAKVKEFAEKHKLTPEQIAAYRDLRKAEIAEAEKLQADAEKEVKVAQARMRRSWFEELKADPVFGGAQFQKNVANAEKVLAEFMPSTKKRLTETKGMLPPYVMRDLAKLHEALYGTDKMVHGDPAVAKVEEDDDDPLAFYNS